MTDTTPAVSLQDIAFERLVRRHDWYYMRSDDYSAFSRGESSYAEIKALAARLPDQTRAREIWAAAAPEGFGFPV